MASVVSGHGQWVWSVGVVSGYSQGWPVGMASGYGQWAWSEGGVSQWGQCTDQWAGVTLEGSLGTTSGWACGLWIVVLACIHSIRARIRVSSVRVKQRAWGSHACPRQQRLRPSRLRPSRLRMRVCSVRLTRFPVVSRQFYNWTLSLGFSCAFGAMFSKTWRVHKIFTNKKIQRMVSRNHGAASVFSSRVP